MKKMIFSTKKHASNPALLAVFLVAAMVFVASCGNNKPAEKEADKTGDMINVHEDNSTVASYVTFVNNDTSKMNLDHTYTNDALMKLTAAVDAMAGAVGYDVKADLDQVKSYATKITEDRSDVSHADTIRKATDMLAMVLENIQKAKYPGLASEAEAVKAASATINPDTLTLNQREAVKSFFSKAADLLQKMN